MTPLYRDLPTEYIIGPSTDLHQLEAVGSFVDLWLRFSVVEVIYQSLLKPENIPNV
jgi:hypothetical protein